MGMSHVLKENPGWSKNTVNTMLSRMCEKGFLRVSQGEKTKLYEPGVEKRSADLAETENLLERVYLSWFQKTHECNVDDDLYEAYYTPEELHRSLRI